MKNTVRSEVVDLTELVPAHAARVHEGTADETVVFREFVFEAYVNHLPHWRVNSR